MKEGGGSAQNKCRASLNKTIPFCMSALVETARPQQTNSLSQSFLFPKIDQLLDKDAIIKLFYRYLILFGAVHK